MENNLMLYYICHILGDPMGQFLNPIHYFAPLHQNLGEVLDVNADAVVVEDREHYLVPVAGIE